MPESSAPTRVVILGATGSIGRAARDVVREHADRYRVSALVAHRSGAELLEAARELQVGRVVLVDEQAAAETAPAAARAGIALEQGMAAACALVQEPDVDVVVQGITGAAGLDASLAAAEAGKRIALANKESFVIAGPLLLETARAHGAVIVPVDSEHSALFQCLAGGKREHVRRLVLTASGGPFRGRRRSDLAAVTPAEALDHPTWDMGPRITVDSASLMNKALEVIEARWLFDVEPERIEVVVHPQSIVHSFVEYVDGSVIAQMGPPDMRTPIRYALSWPERLPAAFPTFRVEDYAQLTFEAPDTDTFPALELGFEAARRGGTAGAALNAADEIAVGRFLDGELPFLDIAERCREALENHPFSATPTLDDIRAVDTWARQETNTTC